MKIFIISLLIFFLFQFMYLFFGAIDSTDKSRWNRSGMKIYTDHKTGVQYLSTGGGLFSSRFLTPRLSSDGKLLTEDAK
jgi:hypothetical protein